MNLKSFSSEVVKADFETLLLSSQVMLSELARRHLLARQNTKKAEQTPITSERAPLTCGGCGNDIAPSHRYCPSCGISLYE